jgi:hypothetical protein
MTREELERLKRRFGPDISAWPAPYRQEAQMFLGEPDETSGLGEDVRLDRLVFEAALMETDEPTLTRQILVQIDRERRSYFGFFPMMWSLRLPAAVASFGAVFIAAGLAGYFVAGPGYGRMDDALLAIATGDPIASGIDTGLPSAAEETFLEEGFL